MAGILCRLVSTTLEATLTDSVIITINNTGFQYYITSRRFTEMSEVDAKSSQVFSQIRTPQRATQANFGPRAATHACSWRDGQSECYSMAAANVRPASCCNIGRNLEYGGTYRTKNGQSWMVFHFFFISLSRSLFLLPTPPSYQDQGGQFVESWDRPTHPIAPHCTP
jgi:hypothetical protein